MVALRKMTSFEIRIKLIKILIVPHFIRYEYGDIIFSSTSNEYLNKLNIAYNNCIRYIFDLKKYDHISEYRSILFGMTLENFYKIRTLCMVFDCIVGNCPEYFINY